jgi:hypothetical protein
MIDSNVKKRRKRRISEVVRQAIQVEKAFGDYKRRGTLPKVVCTCGCGQLVAMQTQRLHLQRPVQPVRSSASRIHTSSSRTSIPHYRVDTGAANTELSAKRSQRVADVLPADSSSNTNYQMSESLSADWDFDGWCAALLNTTNIDLLDDDSFLLEGELL